jgi:hypothetical protein
MLIVDILGYGIRGRWGGEGLWFGEMGGVRI